MSATRSARTSPTRPASTTSPPSATSRCRSTPRTAGCTSWTTYATKDTAFDQKDILKPLQESLTAEDGKLYAEPFYGESSFLMYRKDVFAEKGLTMPERPTWQQVADLAAKADGAASGMKGICLRGLPGWGEVMAPLTTVVNTFGGTWFTKDWKAQLTAPEFTKATKFYVDLVREHGEAGAAQSGFAECLNNLTQGKAAMWYDATSAAGSLEAAESPVKGKIGYVPAPVEKTKSSGWLYTWAWGMQKATKNSDKRLEVHLLGVQQEVRGSWSARSSAGPTCPAGKRASTYANPEYRKAAARLRRRHPEGHRRAPTRANPGVQPRPAIGIQFVGIPEFTDLGTKVSQEISAAIAGKQSVEQALADVAEAGREGRRGVRSDDDLASPTQPLTPPVRRRRRGTPRQRKGGVRAWATRAPLLPALIFLIVVTQLPFVATLVISLFDWNSLDPDNRGFAGLENYKTVLTDPALRDSILTTVLLTATVVIVSVVLGLGLALLLDRKFRGRGLVRTMLITPFLVVPVASALLWKHALYNPEYGLFNGS